MQGKSSKSFRDELGFVGSEEIIHRNNICLLSVIQSTDSDPNQDGVPVLPTEDEPSPAHAPILAQPQVQAYQPQDYPMGNAGSSGTNIPGLSNPSWPPQQAPQPYQYPTGSQPMQSYGAYGVDGGQAHQGHYQSQPPMYSGMIQLLPAIFAIGHVAVGISALGMLAAAILAFGIWNSGMPSLYCAQATKVCPLGRMPEDTSYTTASSPQLPAIQAQHVCM